MSGTGTSTGEFDDDQRGFVTEPDAAVSPETIFVEAAAGTAMTGSKVEDGPPDGESSERES